MSSLDRTPESQAALEARQVSKDDIQLRRLGKNPVLKRTFGFASILGFSCVILVTWEGVVLTYQSSYTAVGPAGTVYSFVFAWLGSFVTSHVAYSLADNTYLACCGGWLVQLLPRAGYLVRRAPTSGGQYHWVSMLAPRSSHKFLSYVTGWLTITAWQAVSATSTLFAAQIIQSITGLCHPDYDPQSWHLVLIGWAVLLFCVVINTTATSSLAKFEGLVLILHIIGFFAVLIPIAYLVSSNVTTDEVFTLWIDGGSWGSRPVSFLIGIVGFVYSFSGSDSAVHMSEEVHNASTLIPKVLLFNILLNGSMGFGMLIAILYAMGPSATAEDILKTKYNYTIFQLLLNITGSVPGTAVMMSVVLALAAFATVGMLASGSRLFWSFARDNGLPFSRQLIRLNHRTNIPVTAVVTTSTISALLLLIAIGSSLVLSDVLSITVAALFASYLLSTVLLLWRRVTNGIQDRDHHGEDGPTHNDASSGRLVWGPFRLPPVIGILNNGLAIGYLIVVFIFVFWPVTQSVTPATMNYACVVFGAVIIFSISWYVFYARRTYKGPLVEVDPAGEMDSTVLSPWYRYRQPQR